MPVRLDLVSRLLFVLLENGSAGRQHRLSTSFSFQADKGGVSRRRVRLVFPCVGYGRQFVAQFRSSPPHQFPAGQ